jgi:phenylpyruvate tautomerase PptA (4-oxalocrotonate tautomerase family)
MIAGSVQNPARFGRLRTQLAIMAGDGHEEATVPYLRITCPSVDAEQRRTAAATLTEAVVEMFTPPRGPSAADVRARTTVHFACYGPDELFVGGRAAEAASPDVTVELSDWSMSTRQQARVAAQLTPVLVRLFDAEPDAVNVRFHPYPPTDFAVGGVLLSRRVPRVARVMKRLFG